MQFGGRQRKGDEWIPFERRHCEFQRNTGSATDWNLCFQQAPGGPAAINRRQARCTYDTSGPLMGIS